MQRIFMNQTALSLGYIALKRIRALEEPTTRLPSNPLLRHLGHIKILAACVEQVGPEEIVEYEINQDVALAEPQIESVKVEADDELFRSKAERKETGDDVFDPRYPKQTCADSPPTEPLFVIKEVEEDEEDEEDEDEECPRRSFYVTNLTCGDLEEGEYSMDELYDEYNAQEDDWETASNVSDDGLNHIENVPPARAEIHSLRVYEDIDTDSDADSEDSEDAAPTPPNVVVSRSPPLDINMRHPITNELSRLERYRRDTDSTSSELSRAFVEQIEDVLCHEIRCLSICDVPGKMPLGTVGQQRVSIYA